MIKYGVAGIHYDGTTWKATIADDQSAGTHTSAWTGNDQQIYSDLIQFIKLQFAQRAITRNKIILVDTPPASDQLYPFLYKEFAFPRVVPANRLSLHAKRLNASADDLSLLAALAGITGFRTDELLLETTNTCTFNCLFCMQDHLTRKKQRLPLEAALKVIDDYAANSIGSMGFHLLGEPTTNPDLAQIVGHAAGLGVKNCLVTNASMLNRRKAEELFVNGLSHLTISVQTFTKEQYYAFKRPAPKFTYESVLQNIKETIQAKWEKSPQALIEIHILDNSLYQPRGVKVITNDEEGLAVIRFWSEFLKEAARESGRDDILDTIVTPGEVAISQATWPIGSIKLAPTIELFFKTAQHWIQNFTERNELIVLAKKGTCGMLQGQGMNQLAILANGDAALCCFDYDGGTRIGNINESSLVEIESKANSIRARFTSDRHIPFPICRRCLGIRIQYYTSKPTCVKNDEITLNRIIIFGTKQESFNTKVLFDAKGIQVLGFLEEHYPTISHPPTNQTGKTFPFESIPTDTEAIIFPPEITPTNTMLSELQNYHPNVLIGHVDLVALNPHDRERILPETKFTSLRKSLEIEINQQKEAIDQLTREKNVLNSTPDIAKFSTIRRILKNIMPGQK